MKCNSLSESILYLALPIPRGDCRIEVEDVARQVLEFFAAHTVAFFEPRVFGRRLELCLVVNRHVFLSDPGCNFHFAFFINLDINYSGSSELEFRSV
jgi:hypothetical protein